MKQILLMIALVALVGCGTPSWISDPSDENNGKIERAIRVSLNKMQGELTKIDLDNVTTLKLWNTRLTNVRGLEKLTKLTNLDLNGNRLTEVPNELKGLTQLKELYLHNNQLKNVRGLENLTQLTHLGLHHNQLTDVKALEKLTRLEHLWIQGSPALTKAQIYELQKALPKCNIRHSHPKK